MPASSPPDPTPVATRGQPAFVTTHWSRVLDARAPSSPEGQEALAILCRDYWYPLFAHVRRRGHEVEEAEDLTQAFFERLLEKKWLNEVNRARGRFRTFLLTALNHFLANEWDKSKAHKRGGKIQLVPFDTEGAETQFQLEPASSVTPETEFNRRWAIALLDHVLQQLRDDYAADGKRHLFETLKSTLEGTRSEVPYSQIAVQVGMTEGAVRVAVHRLRQRYRELLRQEIARTVETPEEVEAELRELFTTLGS